MDTVKKNTERDQEGCLYIHHVGQNGPCAFPINFPWDQREDGLDPSVSLPMV